jgi:tetratricopeptide (TPR) repeat protein
MIRNPEEESMKILILTLMILSSAAVMASGGGSVPSMSQPAAQKSPTERAVDSYNAGIKNREKAWKYQNQAANESDPKKVAKLNRKAEKQFVKAIKKFRSAVKYEPRLYQAHGSLGYALKQTGDFAGAMAAYNHCLELRPNYTPAIEYRAEAYLALGRFDEAREAYLLLEKVDPEKANELEIAFRKWMKSPPESLEPDVFAIMQDWIADNISS